MKKILTIVFIFSLHIQTKGQSYYQKYDAGIKFGVNAAFTDLAKNKHLYSTALNISHFFNPYTAISVEGQFGKLKGGGVATDLHMRQYTNSYMAYYFQGRYYFGNFLYNTRSDFFSAFKNFYISAGIGVIHNSISQNTRVKPDGTGYIFPGLDHSTDLLLPVDIGFDIPLYNRFGEYKWRICVSGQFLQTFGEGLDGYNDPPGKFSNKFPDSFATFLIGMKYSFGKLNYWN